MTTITIADPAQASAAAYWAQAHCRGNWQLDWNTVLYSPRLGYKFQFKDPKDATLFALKWL